MTDERRLAAVEQTLTPVQLAVRWIEEIHVYDDMMSYIRSLADRELGDMPMDRLGRAAKESGKVRSRGMSRSEVDKAVRRSIVETVFRGFLVLEINVRTQDWIDRHSLIHGLLVAHVGLALHGSDGPLKGKALERLVLNRDLLIHEVQEVMSFETARRRVEARYLAGTTTPVPKAQRDWARMFELLVHGADLAKGIAEQDGAAPAPEFDEAAHEARVGSLASELVEPARSKAYNELGDGRRAQAVASAWLRSSFASDGRAARQSPEAPSL